MHRLHQICAVSLATLSLSAGCAQEQDVQPLATAIYAVPFLQETDLPDEEGCWEDNTSVFCPVLITENGELFHQGAPIEIADIKAIEKRWLAGDYALLGIEVHPDAQFRAVVDHLSLLDEQVDEEQVYGSSSLFHPVSTYIPDLYPPFALMGLSHAASDSVTQRNPDALAEFAERDFMGKADEYALPVYVAYSQQHDTCLIKFEASAVSSEQLFDRAFERLDLIVQDGGGIEVLMDEPSVIERIEARLQAESDTPWRCIGPAIHGVAGAGWPEIRLEVIENEAVAH